eukprot:GHVU01120831.1.p1 GENE.GHVU01120831.1~~GHVU01120831.1.p1  ORF type:complete len:111 (-),score=24.40 GHVU01120831.1:56-388(-)
MLEVLDHNPTTGMTTNYEWDASRNGFTLQETQNPLLVKSFVDTATAMRNDESIKQKGIKNSWMHAAIVPRSVMEKMFTEYQINPYKQPKEMIKIVQRDFPWLMTATGKYA